MGTVKEYSRLLDQAHAQNNAQSNTGKVLNNNSSVNKSSNLEKQSQPNSSFINTKSNSLDRSTVNVPSPKPLKSHVAHGSAVQNSNSSLNSSSPKLVPLTRAGSMTVTEAKAAAEAEAMGKSAADIPQSLAAIFNPPPPKPAPGSAYSNKPLSGSLAKLVEVTASEYAEAAAQTATVCDNPGGATKRATPKPALASVPNAIESESLIKSKAQVSVPLPAPNAKARLPTSQSFTAADRPLQNMRKVSPPPSSTKPVLKESQISLFKGTCDSHSSLAKSVSQFSLKNQPEKPVLVGQRKDKAAPNHKVPSVSLEAVDNSMSSQAELIVIKPLIRSEISQARNLQPQPKTIDYYQSGNIENPLYSARSQGFIHAHLKERAKAHISSELGESNATLAPAPENREHNLSNKDHNLPNKEKLAFSDLGTSSTGPKLDSSEHKGQQKRVSISEQAPKEILLGSFADNDTGSCIIEHIPENLSKGLAGNAEKQISENDANAMHAYTSQNPAPIIQSKLPLEDSGERYNHCLDEKKPSDAEIETQGLSPNNDHIYSTPNNAETAIHQTESIDHEKDFALKKSDSATPINTLSGVEIHNVSIPAKIETYNAQISSVPTTVVTPKLSLEPNLEDYKDADSKELLGIPQNFHSPVTLSRIPMRHQESSGRIADQLLDNTEISDAHLWKIILHNRNTLRSLKRTISMGSKSNFEMYTELGAIERRIDLLLQNRIQLEKLAKDGALNFKGKQRRNGNKLSKRKASFFGKSVSSSSTNCVIFYPDVKKSYAYGTMLYILQTEPQHVANLVKMASLNDIDSLLQTVMFTLFGNQYDSREEYLLLSIFQSVLASHFENTTAFPDLLRANTPISRLLTTYILRTPGQQYLKSVLSGRIYHLAHYESDDFEIQPVKIYRKMYDEAEAKGLAANMNPNPTDEEALQNPEVSKIYEKRAKHLMRIATNFLTIIIESARTVPYGIRWICKQIRSLTKRHYPKSTEASICSLIGGFFLLRFVNPAIVSPNAHNLIDFQIGKNPKRTLTLVAKMLQNLANRPSHNKEEYMLVLLPFISANKDRMNRFFLELCEVGDFYESLEIHQYVELSRGPSSVLISLSELYNTQALVEKHLDLLVPAKDHPLREAIAILGNVPAGQISRSEDRHVSIPLCPRWETLPIQISPSSLASGQQQTEADVLYMDTKALLIQLLREMPNYLEAVREEKLDVKRIDLHRPESTPTLTPQAIRDAIAAAQDMGVAPEESGVGRNINVMILNRCIDGDVASHNGEAESAQDSDNNAIESEKLAGFDSGEQKTLCRDTNATKGKVCDDTTHGSAAPDETEGKSDCQQLVDADENDKRVVGRSDSQIFHFDVDLHRVLEIASQSSDPEVNLNGERAQRKLARLKELGILSKDDGYKVLVDELSNDLNHLGSLHVQLVAEIEMMQAALQAVQSKNAFLKRQLEIFMTYLKNVRIQAAYPNYNTLTLLRKMNKLSAAVSKKPKKYDKVFDFSYFEKFGVVLTENLTANLKQLRRQAYFILKFAGTEGVHLCLHIRNREKVVYEVKMELDDLLKEYSDGQTCISLGFLEINVQPLVLVVSQFFL